MGGPGLEYVSLDLLRQDWYEDLGRSFDDSIQWRSTEGVSDYPAKICFLILSLL